MATLKYFVPQALDIAPVSEMTIRSATPLDAEALHHIYRQPQVLENTGVLPQLSLDQVRNWISGLGQSDYLLVAEEGTAVLGVLLLRHPTDPVLRHSGAIGRVAVDGAASGRGVGSRLMAAAVDLADNWLNLYRLELLVRADNQAAIRLYTKFGFEREGLMRGYGYRNGAYMDCLAMARLRGPLRKAEDNQP